MAWIGTLEHSYTQAVVGKFTAPSRLVRRKAQRRVKSEFCPVGITGVSNGVMHFRVASESSASANPHRVEYDMMRKTFRCQCDAGFYGLHCHHVEMILNTIQIP